MLHPPALWIFPLSLLLALAGCDMPPPTSTDAQTESGPPQSGEAKLLARWDSYSYQPAVYGTEALRMFDDGSCEIFSKKGETLPACRWQNDGTGRLEIRIGPSADELKSLFGQLQGSMLADETDRTTGRYLQVQLGKGTTQVFVMGDTQDAEMVLLAVEAEQAWSAGKYGKALGKFRQAVALGSPYGKLRLGWILATVEEFLDPEEAIALVEPLAQHRNYDVQNALAAAQAANGDFSAAVETATGACELAVLQPPVYEQCVNQLSLYRDGQPYTVSIGAETNGTGIPSEGSLPPDD